MAHLGEVRAHFGAVGSLGARVLAVSFAPEEMAAAYRADHALPFPVASDEPREAYAAFGLSRGHGAAVFRPSAVWQHLALRLRGFAPGRHRQRDVYQRGGDFVIGRRGGVVLAHPSEAGDDRVSLDVVLAALRADAGRQGSPRDP